MALDKHTASLVGVGASISANCAVCQTCVATALQRGANPQEIQSAIDIGTKVRAGAASKMDAVARGLNIFAVGAVPEGQPECTRGRDRVVHPGDSTWRALGRRFVARSL